MSTPLTGTKSIPSIFVLGILPLTSCSEIGIEEIPHSICGTPIREELSEPLLSPLGNVTEWNSAGREAGQSYWCIVYVGKEDALHFNFASHGGAMDPTEAASPTNSVTGLQNPHPLHLADPAVTAVTADNGAIATTRCKAKGGADHFTLALKVTRGTFDEARAAAIERFIRAYMPATVKTLNCGKG